MIDVKTPVSMIKANLPVNEFVARYDDWSSELLAVCNDICGVPEEEVPSADGKIGKLFPCRNEAAELAIDS